MNHAATVTTAPVALFVSLLIALPAQATTVRVSMDTTALAGTWVQLAFDFTDGGPPTNTISIDSFSTDGALVSASATGDVAGSLPGTVTLGDTSFFNEYLANITLGTEISFTFTPTMNAPDSGSIPDAFSVFLLDSDSHLFPTTDPTGANALLVYSIDGTTDGALGVFQATGGEVSVTTSVPAPAAALSFCSGLLGLAGLSRVRRQPRLLSPPCDRRRG